MVGIFTKEVEELDMLNIESELSEIGSGMLKLLAQKIFFLNQHRLGNSKLNPDKLIEDLFKENGFF